MPRTPAATTGLSPPCSAWLQAGARAGGRGGARRRVPERRRPRLPQVGGARSPAPGGSATGDPGFLHGRRRERPVRDPAERLAFPWPGARGPPHARTTGAVRGAAGQPRPPSGAVKPRGRAAGCMRRGTYEPARAHAGGRAGAGRRRRRGPVPATAPLPVRPPRRARLHPRPPCPSPSPVLALRFSRKKWPLERCWRPKFWAILWHTVPLPEPGGPRMTARRSLEAMALEGRGWRGRQPAHLARQPLPRYPPHAGICRPPL